MDNEQNFSSNENAPALKNYIAKPLFARTISDILVAICLFLLSVMGVSTLFWNELQLGYTLVFDAMFVLISVFLLKGGVKPPIWCKLCGVLSLVCSASFAITSNNMIKGFIFLATIIASLIWFTAVSGNKYISGDYSLILFPTKALIRAANNLPGTAKGFFAKSNKDSKTLLSVLIGFACAIPAVLIIVPILASSDQAFSSLIGGLFENFAEQITKVVLGTAVSVPIIAIVFSLKYDKKQSESKPISIGISSITVTTFLSVLDVVYLIYLLSQLAYFFSAFSRILPKGYKFTYAGYARRGFFELCAISAINFVLIFAIVLFTEKKNGKLPLAVKIPSVFTTVFTLIIIFTALSKMVMYIDAYALTVSRVFASLFIMWLGILFVGMLIRVFKEKADLLRLGLILALIILSVLGISNINAQIANYNYNKYISGSRKIDVEYLSELGDEGVPYLYKLTKDKDKGIAHWAKRELSYKYNIYYELGEKSLEDIKSYKKFSKLERTWNGISEYSLAKSKAYTVLDKYAKEQNGKVYIDIEYDE